MAMLSHSHFLILLSFSYRVWVLSQLTTTSAASSTNLSVMAAIALASTIPSWIFMVGLHITCAGGVDLPQFAQMTYCAFDLYSDRVGDKWLPRAVIVYTLSFFFSCFAATASLRARLIAKIAELSSAAERTRQQSILRSLTAQALLPACVVAGCFCFLIDFFGIYQSVYLQRAAHVAISIFAFASPLITLTVLQPYRRFVHQMCCGLHATPLVPFHSQFTTQSDALSKKTSTRVGVASN